MFETSIVTEEDIQSLVDGELDDRSSDLILEEIMNSPALFSRLSYYVGQREQLRFWWRAQNMEH